MRIRKYFCNSELLYVHMLRISYHTKINYMLFKASNITCTYRMMFSCRFHLTFLTVEGHTFVRNAYILMLKLEVKLYDIWSKNATCAIIIFEMNDGFSKVYFL